MEHVPDFPEFSFPKLSPEVAMESVISGWLSENASWLAPTAVAAVGVIAAVLLPSRREKPRLEKVDDHGLKLWNGFDVKRLKAAAKKMANSYPAIEEIVIGELDENLNPYEKIILFVSHERGNRQNHTEDLIELIKDVGWQENESEIYKLLSQGLVSGNFDINRWRVELESSANKWKILNPLTIFEKK